MAFSHWGTQRALVHLGNQRALVANLGTQTLNALKHSGTQGIWLLRELRHSGTQGT